MMKHDLVHRVLAFGLALFLPTIACFGYYSVQFSDLNGAFYSTLTVLAYPLALISLAVLVLSFTSKYRLRWLRLPALVCLLGCAALLIVLRL